MPSHLAIDLGAESGRLILGSVVHGKLNLRELHRFPNQPVKVRGHLHWDILSLWREILKGLHQVGSLPGEKPSSLGVDTWGVDYGLFDAAGRLLSNPYHYRDSRTKGMMDNVVEAISAEQIYRLTGIQFLPFNTLFQLAHQWLNQPLLIKAAEHLLMMPDIFHYWLSGRMVNELTIATTSQCLNPTRGTWAVEVLEAIGLPKKLFGEIVSPGTLLGDISDEVSEICNTGKMRVIAPASHDTAAAVAAAPLASENALYLSSGTWSLMGIEAPQPIITTLTREFGFTNEGGACGTTRVLKNIMGLWLVQECRRAWQQMGFEASYSDLTEMARNAQALTSWISVNDERFLPPGNMPARVRAFCRETGQTIPETRGQILRVILESLALEYRWVLEKLKEITNRPLDTIHIIGGGVKNHLLNQLTADATGCLVQCGPIEATAIGNILTQAIALGELENIAEGRHLVKQSFPITKYEPGKDTDWDAAYDTYQSIREKGKQPT